MYYILVTPRLYRDDDSHGFTLKQTSSTKAGLGVSPKQIDPDCAAEGPQPQRELNEIVRELKTDDFNQQGEKNDFMATVD